MILLEEIGDIFESSAQSLVVPVNVVGVAGKGLAKAFADRFPTWLKAYKHACETRVFERHGFHVHSLSDGRRIVSLPTKRHWRFPSKIEWIDEGLRRLAEEAETYGITSLAIPAIGCGEGRLRWEDVRVLIHRYLGVIELPVAVYLPQPR